MVVLGIKFELNEVDCVSYKLVTESMCKKIYAALKNPESSKFISVIPYYHAAPSELTGPELDAKTILSRLEKSDAPDFVAAFQLFHGDDFNSSSCHFIDLLIEEINAVS